MEQSNWNIKCIGGELMKTTIRAVLINVPKEADETLSNMMKIFCTAIRFSFKRLL